MKKTVLIGTGLLAALLGIGLGVLLTAQLNQVSPAGAVEPVAAPALSAPVQATTLFGKGQPPLPSFSDLAKRVSPSVVNISTTKAPRKAPMPGGPPLGPRDPFDDFFEHYFQGPNPRPQQSLGSGFLISQDGYIITNNHVVQEADEIQVRLTDKRKFAAKVIGSDPKTDLAVIKITASSLPAATLGNSDQLNVGDWVMAVGNPFGLEQTVTAGIVSAKARIIGAGPYDDFIQTDASINPGNSGGPLFNLQGEVVGVNSAIVASGQGIGFAIPINMAKELVPQLIKSGKVTRAWLGVGIQEITPELAQSFGQTEPRGGLVSNVFPKSPADKAGFQSGDIVTDFDGHQIKESHELPALVARTPIGKKVPVKILRDGKEKLLEVTLGEMEEGEKAITEETTTSSKELGLAVRDMMPEEWREAAVKEGVLIMGVEPGSAADLAGCQRGDILLSLGNTKLTKANEFYAAAKQLRKGQVIRLHLKRDDQMIFLAFTK